MSSGTTTVTIPPNTAAGQYYLIAAADADGTVAETLETNNTFTRAIPVGSDLYVSALSLPATGGAGGSIVVSDTTANQGGGGSPVSVTRFYLSANSTLDAGDVRLDEEPGRAGACRGSVERRFDECDDSRRHGGRRVPSSSRKPTTTTWSAKPARPTIRRAARVTIGPDLTISTFSLSATSVTAGSAVVITDTVANVGAGAAGASVTRFYLSTNAVLDAGDLMLAPGRPVPGIGGATSSAGSTSVTIPAGTAAGSYYVFAKADGDGAVGESLESNNASGARLVQVTSAP